MNKKIAELNLEGEVCPYVLIGALKKVQEIEKDLKERKKRLEIIVDCAPSIENIPFELEKKGFKVKIEKLGPAKWKIIIE